MPSTSKALWPSDWGKIEVVLCHWICSAYDWYIILAEKRSNYWNTVPAPAHGYIYENVVLVCSHSTTPRVNMQWISRCVSHFNNVLLRLRVRTSGELELLHLNVFPDTAVDLICNWMLVAWIRVHCLCFWVVAAPRCSSSIEYTESVVRSVTHTNVLLLEVLIIS